MTRPLLTPLPTTELTRRLATSVPLRLTAASISDAVAHLHADIGGTDRAAAADAVWQRYPAFQALLTHRLATTPAASVAGLDQALVHLALADEPRSLEYWVADLAGALAA
jgi:hypothetical protein